MSVVSFIEFTATDRLTLTTYSAAFTLAVMLFRTKRSPPFGPGRAPLISSRLFSASMLDERVIAGRDLIHAHVAGHADALLGLTALAAPRGARGDRAGRAVLAFGAVRSALAAEVMPLHDAGEAFALAGADHVDVLHAVEQFDRDVSPGVDIGGVLQADLREMLASARRRPWRRGPSAGRC